MDSQKNPIRIDLTPEQKAKVRDATGKDAEAVELSVEELEERIAPRKKAASRGNLERPSRAPAPQSGRRSVFRTYPLPKLVSASHNLAMTDLLSVPPASLEELRREVERLRLLHSITLEFNATLDFDQLLPRVFDRVLAAVGAAGGSLWIAEGDMLHCRLAVGGAAGTGRRPDAGGDRLRG